MSKVVSLPVLDIALASSADQSAKAQAKFEQSNPEPTVNRAAISALAVTMKTMTEANDPALIQDQALVKAKSDLQPYIVKAKEIATELDVLAKQYSAALEKLSLCDWQICNAVYSKAAQLRGFVVEALAGLNYRHRLGRIGQDVERLTADGIAAHEPWNIEYTVKSAAGMPERVRELMLAIGEMSAILQLQLDKHQGELVSNSIDRSAPEGEGRQTHAITDYQIF